MPRMMPRWLAREVSAGLRGAVVLALLCGAAMLAPAGEARCAAPKAEATPGVPGPADATGRRLSLPAALVAAALAAGSLAARAGAGPACSADIRDGRITLRSPAFEVELGTAGALAARSWTNRLTGHRMALAGPELGIDLDAADQRLFITGWQTIVADTGSHPPDEEHGYKVGAYAPEHDDTSWTGRPTALIPCQPETPLFGWYFWARTHVFLPAGARGKRVSLILGGTGMFGYRYLRAFANGRELGARRQDGRWHEPHTFVMEPGSPGYESLRFGHDNVIALQLSGYTARSEALDAVDPKRLLEMENSFCWPPQFEQVVVIGTPLAAPALRVVGAERVSEGDQAEVRVRLASRQPALEAVVTYRWNSTEPVLHKSVAIRNAGRQPRRVMNVRLGDYAAGEGRPASVTGGEQGFPVYLDGERFVSIAHPAGWATGGGGRVLLRQYPGRMLASGESLACMETVYGVAKAGGARERFLEHVRSRMRRVRRGHDRPYAIFESFGSWPSGNYWGGTEADALHAAERMAAGIAETGCRFDLFCVELWIDRAGDLERADPKRFPRGMKPITQAAESAGTKLGLWWDTGGAYWSIYNNPVVSPSLYTDRSYGLGDRLIFCQAEGVYEELMQAALKAHLEGGARLLKFDGLCPICYNPHHSHLPGIYSTEAIVDKVIRDLDELDRLYPDALVMLYWGHRSPWWLLHGDTLFEPGFWIEAASPTEHPAPHARDSVTVCLDRAHAFCKDVPPLGKDSLGIWLSDWGWNSSIGKERWQEGMVMDLARGSLLAQVWTDYDWLTEPERRQFAQLVALLRAHPECFSRPRPVLGDPWKHEPYGYCCTDGRRAFAAINNCTWNDLLLPLPLGPEWGLKKGERWDVYRWYPAPARIGDTLRLRPFEVALLEVVPKDSPPSPGAAFPDAVEDAALAEASRELTARVTADAEAAAVPVEADGSSHPKRAFQVAVEAPASAGGGTVVVTAELAREGAAAKSGDIGRRFAASAALAGQTVAVVPVLGHRTYPSCWQGWRVEVSPAPAPEPVVFRVTAAVDPAVEVTWRAHWVAR